MLPQNIKTIIDLTIGDGWLGYRRQSEKYPHFDIMHSIKQLEYAKHKENLFLSLGYKTKGYIYTDPRTNCLYYRFYTQQHPDFGAAYKHIYNKQIKAIDKHLLRDLDEISLAYIFMDDGCAHTTQKSKHGNKYQIFEHPVTTAYRISLNSFTKPEIEQFQNWLYTRFSIESKLEPQWNSYRIIIGRNESKDIFRTIISPYIIKSMEYKIINSHTFNNIPFTIITGSQTERESSSLLEDDATVES